MGGRAARVTTAGPVWRGSSLGTQLQCRPACHSDWVNSEAKARSVQTAPQWATGHATGGGAFVRSPGAAWRKGTGTTHRPQQLSSPSSHAARADGKALLQDSQNTMPLCGKGSSAQYSPSRLTGKRGAVLRAGSVHSRLCAKSRSDGGTEGTCGCGR